MTVFKNLKQPESCWTEREIKQQPESWVEVLEDLQSHTLRTWFVNLTSNQELRIILTGAGTSAYIGDVLAPYLTKHLNRRVEAISTTDIVSDPEQYLISHVPTLLISFGRSGDSPESVAAARLAEQLVGECHHLVLSCNRQGRLVQFAQQAENAHTYVLPAQTLDKSFAMTSSFTSMCIAALCLLAPDEEQLLTLADSVKIMLKHWQEQASNSASKDIKRVIFLGSGCLQGIAKEASLKYLELTAGKVDCYYQSPLGFRHGPKSSVDSKTQIYVLTENDSYTSLYDRSIIEELRQDGCAREVVQLSSHQLQGGEKLQGAWLGLAYIVFGQLLALHQSVLLGMNPDNPFPTGEVNRVVQGVDIYPFFTS